MELTPANPRAAAAPSAPAAPPPFSGSYAPEDCRFLLKPLPPRFVGIAEKERLIQREGRHYSEFVSQESAPDPEYLALFEDLTERYRARLAGEILALAAHLAATRPAPITLVSLARAGTPFGVLLRRALVHRLGVSTRHYSISIVRDRGIDTNALRHILRVDGRNPAGLVFADAWTAKGVITGVLKAAIADWNRREPERLDDRLCVISDIGGSADLAATHDDYAIPSGILNATVSGLVSRTILNAEIGPEDFHGCVLYDALRPHDRSRWFVERIDALLRTAPIPPLPPDRRAQRQALTADWLDRCRRETGIANLNHIKPGVAESTRVMLRRIPRRLILRDPDLPDVRHLRRLAALKDIETRIDPDLPFNAAALIRLV